MMFPAKLPTMLTMAAVVISGRGERFERDLFAGQERWGLNNIFPALRDGELALRLWAHRINLRPDPVATAVPVSRRCTGCTTASTTASRARATPGSGRTRSTFSVAEGHVTREAKAADILKAHRATSKVAKARELSPAFDAECRAAEQPVGFWQWAGYVHGRLRHDCGYLKMLALAGMILFLVWIAPFIWLLVKMFLISS